MQNLGAFDPFPPIWSADEDGLLFVGGQLTPDWLVAAYRRGIFPWPVVYGKREVLAWFSPDPRSILELEGLHVPRRLARRLRNGQFEVTFDQAFRAVIAACAAPRRRERRTWITPSMMRAYARLHELGIAHSVEVWEAGQLVGGLYGVGLGGYFAGESMFHIAPDASKAAVVRLVERLRQRGFQLFDIQQQSDHMENLGATEIPRAEFLRRVEGAVVLDVTF
jgi:leucyl/phenylalanyl-tRNA---protein transferase